MMGTPTRIYLWACWSLLISPALSAQHLKLGNRPSQNTRSAVLELESANQGLLLSRIADTQAINAQHPPDGMIIYFTDGAAEGPYGENAGMYQRINGSWRNVMLPVDTVVATDQAAVKFTLRNGRLTLHIPNATTGLRGLISSGRQSFSGRKTFNDSVRIKNLHSGSVVFVRGGTDTLNHVLTENRDLFFWDNVNGRLGLGTNDPGATLDVDGSFRLGNGGSVLHYIINYTFSTGSDIPVDAESHHLFTVPIAGISGGGSVIASPGEELPDGLIVAYGFTTDGAVQFKVTNVGSAATNIPAGTKFHLLIVQ